MNTCQCPVPPGGTVSCPDDHLSVCRVVDGKAEAICVPPFPHVSADEQRRQFVEIIMGSYYDSDPKDPQSILTSGSYTSPDGRMEVTFNLPRSRNVAVAT